MEDVAVTIVNYNTNEDLLQSLSTYFADLKGSSLKIKTIVVDNASRNDLEPEITDKFPDVLFRPLPENIGFGAAHNLAMESVPARYYFILNPDILFPAKGKTIDRLFHWMEAHKSVGMVGPKLRNPDGELQVSCYRFPTFWTQPVRRLGFQDRYDWARSLVDRFIMSSFSRTETIPVDWIMGAAMFLRREARLEVGPFDPRFFMYYEDVDLCRRLWARNWPVHYVHDIELVHKHRRDSASIPGIKGIFLNPLTRIHLKSWINYFMKWAPEPLPNPNQI